MKAKDLGIDLSILKNLDFSGTGGKEKKFLAAMEKSWIREDGKLYDFYNDSLGLFLELKKQGSQNWLDPSKFYGITEKQKKIIYLFCLTNKKGKPEIIFTVRLGDLVSNLWTEEQLHAAHVCMESAKLPRQIKDGFNARKWFKHNRNLANVIYISEEWKAAKRCVSLKQKV